MPKQLIAALLMAGLLVMSAGSPALASSWLMSGHDAQGTFYNAGEHTITRANVRLMRRVWSVKRVTDAIATDTHVYAVLWPTAVVFDARSGAVVRRFLPRSLNLPPSAYATALAYAKGKLLVGEWWPGGAAVLALNPSGGQIVWRARVPASSLTVWGATVYTGFGCQNLCRTPASYGLDLSSGRILWKHPGNFGQQPVFIAGRLYQTWSGGYGAGETQVYDPGSGVLAATLPLVAQWFGDRSSVLADVRVSPAKGSWLGRISPSGKPAWKLSLGKATGHAVYAYHTVYASSNRFHPGLLAVNASNGKILWASTVADNPLAVANHIVFAQGGATGPVHALDAGSGKTLTTFTAGRGASALVAGGSLYVVDQTGLTVWRG